MVETCKAYILFAFLGDTGVCTQGLTLPLNHAPKPILL
jgi:hypothetical protein